MTATIQFGSAARGPGRDRPIATIDPIDYDLPGDEAFLATRRGMCRVATVAAEAGARFQRDGTGVDPMAWMLAPRTMFGGEAPIDACRRRGPFLRGVLVHGLGLDLDMGAEEVDDLLEGDASTLAAAPPDRPHRSGGGRAVIPTSLPAPPPRLFTATVVSRDGFETLHAFHASLAVDDAEVADRLFCRMGDAAADAIIVEGFDASDPMVEALVAPAIANTLALVADDPVSPLAAGLDLNVEQRFLG
ncbi:MAG: hypothetical protein KYX69_11300 [Sphingomonas sp.]|uniref:hypothetical protein n=1 Tax=Sphingomonas sp. TaxID=28214 RepID=UPI00262C116C|nr:hypothetical protein [Sphingomonas sp.]MDK2768291.1 hypothetical protein [Sphingomonas sp.]